MSHSPLPNTASDAGDTDANSAPPSESEIRFPDPFGETTKGEDAPGFGASSPYWPSFDPRSRCILVGPSGVGKTSFLLALGRACQLPIQEGIEVRFIPDSTSTVELMEKAVRSIAGRETFAEPTSELQEFGFQLKISDQRRGHRSWNAECAADMVWRDGPGESFFPTGIESSEIAAQYWSLLLDEARRASCLLLFVDALKPCADTWQARLPKLLYSLADGYSQHGRVLGFDRVLLLLSRVDRLCANTLESIRQSANRSRAGEPVGPRDGTLRHLSRLRCSDLARAIDPLAQVRELLGVSLLKELSDAMRPDARLAVGLASAGGFDPGSGDPLFDEGGQLRIASPEDRDDSLRRWAPFGVQEALLFAALGRTVHPIVPVSRVDLSADRSDLPEEIASSVSGT